VFVAPSGSLVCPPQTSCISNYRPQQSISKMWQYFDHCVVLVTQISNSLNTVREANRSFLWSTGSLRMFTISVACFGYNRGMVMLQLSYNVAPSTKQTRHMNQQMKNPKWTLNTKTVCDISRWRIRCHTSCLLSTRRQLLYRTETCFKATYNGSESGIMSRDYYNNNTTIL
jgi:hypothetical protein